MLIQAATVSRVVAAISKCTGFASLVLDHDRPAGHGVTVADIAHAQGGQITVAKLAVQAQIEQGRLAYAVLHLQTDPDGPNVFRLEWCLLPDDLAPVPWDGCALTIRFEGVHSDLLIERRRQHASDATNDGRAPTLRQNREGRSRPGAVVVEIAPYRTLRPEGTPASLLTHPNRH